MKLTIGNLKGGVARTTSAIYLALALAREGRTLLVDADPQGSALDWSEQAEDFPCVVIPWTTNDLARRVKAVSGDYEHVVIDTPPFSETLLRQALLATDQLVVPVGASVMEARRLQPTFAMAGEIGEIKSLDTVTLLARCDRRTTEPQSTRKYISESLGLPVLETETHELQEYKRTWGTSPSDLGEYDAILAELKSRIDA